jgi:hypothetical protein
VRHFFNDLDKTRRWPGGAGQVPYRFAAWRSFRQLIGLTTADILLA